MHLAQLESCIVLLDCWLKGKTENDSLRSAWEKNTGPLFLFQNTPVRSIRPFILGYGQSVNATNQGNCLSEGVISYAFFVWRPHWSLGVFFCELHEGCMLCLFVKVSAKEQENHFPLAFPLSWMVSNTGHGSHLPCFSINAVVQRRQMRIMVYDWAWGGRAKKRGEREKGTGNLTATAT